MTQAEPAARASATVISRLGRLARFILFLCTAGWAFPHVCTEDLDLTKVQDGRGPARP